MKKTPPPTPPRADMGARPPIKTSNPEVVLDRETNRPRFVKGNTIWQLIKSRGRACIISDGDDLWQSATNYFKWCDENPLNRSELVKHQGDAVAFDVPLGMPYSIDGLTIYLGVSGTYFRSRKAALADRVELKTATDADIYLLETIYLIESVVRTQRFNGAAVGLFKENLISRVDGYADNTNVNNSGEVRQSIVVRDQKTADDLSRLDDMLK